MNSYIFIPHASMRFCFIFIKYCPFNSALIRIFYVKLRFFLFLFCTLRAHLGSNGFTELDIKNKNSILFSLSLSLSLSLPSPSRWYILEHSIFQVLSVVVHSRKYISHNESVRTHTKILWKHITLATCNKVETWHC